MNMLTYLDKSVLYDMMCNLDDKRNESSQSDDDKAAATLHYLAVRVEYERRQKIRPPQFPGELPICPNCGYSQYVTVNPLRSYAVFNPDRRLAQLRGGYKCSECGTEVGE
jgi:predicted RNA-binding Zn-ribbon protein involved in translation (DUF1610 family)